MKTRTMQKEQGLSGSIWMPVQYAFPTIYLIIHSGQLPLQGFPCSVWNVRGTDAEAELPIAGCITAALWWYNSLEEESDTTSRTQLTGNNIICHYSLTHVFLFHPWNTKCQFLTLFFWHNKSEWILGCQDDSVIEWSIIMGSIWITLKNVQYTRV